MAVNLPVSLLTVSILVRWLVAQFPYSGHSNPPMFGDYEAQRHWMEVTTNLPVRDWYKNTTDNDLLYWGLDYPPLTAYHMFALGAISNKFINSTWTELHKSRGFESYEHKLFMRLTVIISELFIYSTAIVYYFYKTQPVDQYSSPPSSIHKQNVAIYTAMLLFYPAQILIDHGHFQYNSVFIGLVLWAVVFMIQSKQFLAAITFTLALTYKQMALYYALPFFWLIASSNLRVRPIWKGLRNIILVGVVVMSVLAIVFSPYLHQPESILQVTKRIFPFNRGLFEDKVANFWFSLSIFYKFRNIYSTDDLLKASTALTLLLTIPSGLHLLLRPSIRNFKYSLVTTSMVFFLFSFQVHEKTILVPALPILLLAREHSQAANWFVIISTFSLQPLLIRDGQIIPYFTLMVIYTLISLEIFQHHVTISMRKMLTLHNVAIFLYLTSILSCFILSLASVLIKAPARYPHIHSTMNALYSSGHFMAFLLYFYYRQFRPKTRPTITTERARLIKKDD